MSDQSGTRSSLLQADPVLSKFNPLSRILTVDDFSRGLNGWTELVANHNAGGDLATIDPHMRDFRPPQLSNCSFFDVGSHGALTGDYAMKLATRPITGSTAVAIRRLCMAGTGRVQFEAYLAYKTEAVSHGAGSPVDDSAGWDGNTHPSERWFGSFSLGTDLCAAGGLRYHCVARYQNTDLENRFTRAWMYPTIPEPTPKERLDGKYDLPPRADYLAPGPEYWAQFATQSMCYNEVPTKVNWHYVRWLIDTSDRRNIELQVNSETHDMRHVPVPPYEERYESLEDLLNFHISVRTHGNVRNLLFLDSAVVSVDW